MERLKGNDLMSIPPQFKEPMSSNNLNNFVSTFHTNEGYAQPNKYEVLIYPPRPPKIADPPKIAVTDYNPSKKFISEVSNDSPKISLRCESVTLPGRNLSTTPDSNIHGPLREVVNNVNYADSVTMVFQASADLRERVFFEKWQYTAFNPDTFNNLRYADDTILMAESKEECERGEFKSWVKTQHSET